MSSDYSPSPRKLEYLHAGGLSSIDTNCYTALMRGDEAVVQFLDDADIVYLSTIVAGELMAGFKDGTMERQHRQTRIRYAWLCGT